MIVIDWFDLVFIGVFILLIIILPFVCIIDKIAFVVSKRQQKKIDEAFKDEAGERMSRSGTYDPKLGFIPNDDCETPRQTNAEKLMEFLEETLPQIVTPTTDALYAVSIDENRVPKTVFYNCDSVDRWAIIGAIFADAMLAFVEDNAEEINKVLNGEVEEDGSKS